MNSIFEATMDFENLNTDSDINDMPKGVLNELMETYNTQKQHLKSLTNIMSEGLAHCKIIRNETGVPIDYRFLSVNPSFEKHTGLTPEMCVGKTILEIMPDAEKSWIDFYGRVGTTLKSETITGYNKHTKRYYTSTGYSDTIGEFMMLFEDITEEVELKKAQDAVLKSSKLTSDVLSNMPVGFQRSLVICDENNHPIDFKILEINEAYERLVGVKKEDVVGKTILEILPNMDLDQINRYCHVGLTGESNNYLDICNVTGKIFDVSIFSPKLGEFVLFIKDATEKETSRINLEKAYQKVEESEKLKTSFLANMSHEIRTPLNAILGCSELLEDKTLNSEDQDKCLNHIKNSGDRLLTIISDILDISKLDSKQQQLNLKSHCLNAIMDRLNSQFSIVKKDSTNSLEFQKTFKNNNSFIKTDATRLEQIISNLLENAFKYTENGEITFGYELKGDYLEFFVKDTGRGISDKDKNLIFERFGQVNNQIDKVNSGSGLGIPIANGFVALFGGEMWLESEVNNGSTFYFKIPYIPCAPEDSMQKKPTILVADDEDVNFYLIEMWLGDYCNLLHASDGNKVLNICRSEDIDLILMDIKMPYLSGTEATIEIRKTDQKIPIIAQSAFVMQSETEEILAAGCNEIITKPIRQETFKKVLSAYLPQLKF